MPFDFNTFLDNLKASVATLAKSTLRGYEKEAVSGAEAFLKEADEDLKLWTGQLAKGDIDEEDFKDLVAGEKDLAKMTALTQKGLAKAAIDTFTSGLVDAIVDTAIKMI